MHFQGVGHHEHTPLFVIILYYCYLSYIYLVRGWWDRLSNEPCCTFPILTQIQDMLVELFSSCTRLLIMVMENCLGGYFIGYVFSRPQFAYLVNHEEVT
jgi:hypothetical protein